MAEQKPKRYISDIPELMTEWNWKKNDELGLDPTKLTHGSGQKAHWICSKGHKWESTISNRAFGNSCPYCSGRLPIVGVTDLATTHPELAKEWHPTKNGNLKPTDVTSGSGKKVWWICNEGHEWQAIIRNRSRDKLQANCPICSGHKVLIGYNDLATRRPDLAQQWHPTKNGNLKPTDVTSGSGKKVWWKCHVCGHEWQAKVVSRTCHNTGCLVCESKKRKLPVPIKFNTIVKMQKAKELTVMAALQCLNMSRATYYRRIKELQL